MLSKFKSRPLLVWVVGGLCLAALLAVGITRGLRRRNQPITLEALRSLAQREPTPRHLTELVERCLVEQQGEEAVQAAKKLVDLLPNEARAHNLLGAAYGERGDNALAIQEFNRAIALNPRLDGTYENMGRLSLRMHQPAQALAQFDLATSIAPKSALAWQGLGEAAEALHYAGQATDAYQHAIAADPKRPAPYALLGIHYASNNQGSDARPNLKKALELGYESAPLYAGLAMAYADAPEGPNDLEQALKYADQAEQLGDRSALLYYARALASQRLNRISDAIHAFQQVLDQDRTASGAWIGLSQCYRAQGNTKKADELAETGEKVLAERQRTSKLAREVQNNPDRLDLRERYAGVLMTQHKYLDAASELQYVAQRRPDQPREWLKVADAMEKGGRRDMARYLRDYAVQAKQDQAHGKKPTPAPSDPSPAVPH